MQEIQSYMAIQASFAKEEQYVDVIRFCDLFIFLLRR